MMLTQMLRLPRSCEITGRKPGSFYLDIKNGLMVPPVRIGPNAAAWPAHELEAINRAKIAGATEDEIRALVRRLIEARKQPDFAAASVAPYTMPRRWQRRGTGIQIRLATTRR